MFYWARTSILLKKGPAIYPFLFRIGSLWDKTIRNCILRTLRLYRVCMILYTVWPMQIFYRNTFLSSVETGLSSGEKKFYGRTVTLGNGNWSLSLHPPPPRFQFKRIMPFWSKNLTQEFISFVLRFFIV